MAHYLDASALAKLVLEEPESAALRAWLSAPGRLATSSDLARTELLRAARRRSPDLTMPASALLQELQIQRIGADLYEAAGRLDPPSLRALDAIHVTCALNLRESLESFVTYDTRQADAARASGILVSTPV